MNIKSILSFIKLVLGLTKTVKEEFESEAVTADETPDAKKAREGAASGAAAFNASKQKFTVSPRTKKEE